MIVEWMVYSALCAAGLSLAALLAERVLLSGRGPVRWVWIVAVLLSLLIPAAAFRLAGRSDSPGVPDLTRDVAAAPDGGALVAGAAPHDGATHSLREARSWRATLARYDAAIVRIWITLSLAVAGNLAAGIIVLALMRRRWQRRTVL